MTTPQNLSTPLRTLIELLAQATVERLLTDEADAKAARPVRSESDTRESNREVAT